MVTKKIMIFAPHPDDELIGCGGIIIKAYKEKNTIKIIYITKGCTKKEGNKKAVLRKKAVISIAQEVYNCNQKFFDYYEKELLDIELAKDCFSKIKDQIHLFGPDEIYIPAYEGGNIDHDITNFLVAKATKNGEYKLYEYEMYNNYFSPRKIIEILIREFIKKLTKKYFYWDKSIFIPKKDANPFYLKMSKEEVKEKLQMLTDYQNIAEMKLDNKRPRILLQAQKYEDLLRILPKYDYKKKPHKILPLNYTMAEDIKFRSFQDLVKKFERIC